MKYEDKYFGFVYETTNLINHKRYIGKCIFSRQNNWKSYLGSGVYFKRAVKKYGKENFSREILFLALDEKELNQLEEDVLKLTNAVKSPNYYNLKETSIGGDSFSHHPEKERIRKLKANNMTGSSNHQYGKPKTHKMLKSVKESNSKKVYIDNTFYTSSREYERKTGILFTVIHYRLNSPYYPNYQYVDEDGSPIPKILKEKKAISRESKPVIVNGVEYQSIKQAVGSLKIGRQTLLNRLKDDNYPDYQLK